MHPHSLFQRLDRDLNDSITSYEILNFLRDNRVYHSSEPECYALLKYFDTDEDGRLTYHEFQRMLLPCEDNLLRRVTLDRPSQRVGRFDCLPRDIESALTELLEKELDLMRRSDNLKRDLFSRYDYSTYSTFRTVDRYNDGFIDSYNLKVFLKNNGHYADDREVLSIIRRIDTDGDAKLNYEEFSEFLRLSGSSSRP